MIEGGLRAAFFLFLAASLHAGPVLAHGDDKPKHGGIMGRGDDSVTVEFVFRGDGVTVYIEDHDRGMPIPSDKVKEASLTVYRPGAPLQQGKLIPAGENKLSGQGFTPRVGDRVNLKLVLPDGAETWSTVTFREPRPRR